MHLSHEYTFFFLQNPRSLLPRFKSRSCCSCVTSGQTVVQKEPCKMSHEKQGLPCFVVLVPCSDQAEPPAKLAPHCCRLVRYSQLLVHTRPALPTMSRWGDCGDRVWQSCLHPCLPHCHPQLLADLDLWGPSALDAAWWNSAVPSDTGGLSLTLIASLRNHLSNLCSLLLLD